MREEEIVKALAFIQSDKVKGVPLEERLKFLTEKLTSEEIQEVKKRFEGNKPSTVAKVEPAARRLETVNNHFSLFTAVNVASLAVLTTIGVNMMLDSIKDKKESALREEIKDRIKTNLNDNCETVKAIAQQITDMNARICDQEEVEEIVARRIDQYENTQNLTDVKNKTLNLKIRSQPNQSRSIYDQLQEETKSPLDQLRTEMIGELKALREDMQAANKTNMECIAELKGINLQLKANQINASSGALPSVGLGRSLTLPADSVQSELIPSVLESKEMTQEEKIVSARAVDSFIDSFEQKDQKNLAVTRFSMPLSQMIKNPTQEKWRTIQFSNALLKPVVNSNQTACETFLKQCGFERVNDSSFKFAGTNLKVPETISDLLKEKLDSGKLTLLESSEQSEPEPVIEEVKEEVKVEAAE